MKQQNKNTKWNSYSWRGGGKGEVVAAGSTCQDAAGASPGLGCPCQGSVPGVSAPWHSRGGRDGGTGTQPAGNTTTAGAPCSPPGSDLAWAAPSWPDLDLFGCSDLMSGAVASPAAACHPYPPIPHPPIPYPISRIPHPTSHIPHPISHIVHPIFPYPASHIPQLASYIPYPTCHTLSSASRSPCPASRIPHPASHTSHPIACIPQPHPNPIAHIPYPNITSRIPWPPPRLSPTQWQGEDPGRWEWVLRGSDGPASAAFAQGTFPCRETPAGEALKPPGF